MAPHSERSNRFWGFLIVFEASVFVRHWMMNDITLEWRKSWIFLGLIALLLFELLQAGETVWNDRRVVFEIVVDQ